MNAHLPPALAAALAPFAPRSSVVHRIVKDDAAERRLEERRIDRQQAYLRATGQGHDFPRDFSTVEARL